MPDGRRVRMHTCYFGMDADLVAFGQNYLTATNPHPRRASDLAPCCTYCNTLCFVDRVLPDGRRVRMHTCYFGMDADLVAFGQNYLTATNPTYSGGVT
ncbi:MAG: hypothetical protein M3186_13700 [Actinomycetota bacterium]|nr:hypothetical protein [Actinomycetota bacterium]